MTTKTEKEFWPLKSEGSEEKRTEQIKQVKSLNGARSSIYGFLSTAFKKEVDEDYFENIASIDPAIQLLSDIQGGEALRENSTGLLEFRRYVGGLKGNESRRLITDLAVEYARLLLGVGPNPVRPIESVRVGRDRVLYQEPYHQVVKTYRSIGFEKGGFPEPEDHIAVEFDFMQHLCDLISAALNKEDLKTAVENLEVQREFLNDHILKWVPDFCLALGGASRSTFYSAVSRLTNAFKEAPCVQQPKE
jgi:TorA maturation chaperone TorD